MIDFWEAIGRLASDKKLAEGFAALLPPPGPFRYVELKRSVYINNEQYQYPCTGVDIPEELYLNVQKYLEPVLAERYLSLMAAGELIMAFSYPQLREAAARLLDITAISEARPQFSSPSASYFINLGLLLVDTRFRHKVQRGEDYAVERLDYLPDAQRENLLAIMDTDDFKTNIRPFELLWPCGCNALWVFEEKHYMPMGLSGHGCPENVLKY